MNVSTAAERTERSAKDPSETPVKAEEGLRSPLRRRLLRAAVGVLVAETLIGGGILAKGQFDKFFARTNIITGPEIPKLPPVEPTGPPSEKAINKVPLTELTKKSGIMSTEQYTAPLSTENPYAFSLSLNNGTIVDVERIDPKTAWIAVAMPGEKLERSSMGGSLVNFDGTKTEKYFYKGFTAWILIDDRVINYTQKGSNSRSPGIAGLENYLKIGKTIGLLIHLNQFYKNYQEMNKQSFDRLSETLGKSNADRSDQAFQFAANLAVTEPN